MLVAHRELLDTTVLAKSNNNEPSRVVTSRSQMNED